MFDVLACDDNASTPTEGPLDPGAVSMFVGAARRILDWTPPVPAHDGLRRMTHAYRTPR